MEQTPTLLLDKARRFRTARIEQGRQVTDPPCIVLLGRLGDVINALPIAWHLSKLHGKPVPFIVAKQFADPVLATSYAKAEIWDGEFFGSLNAAVKSASERYGKVLVLQTNGQGYVFRKSAKSFCNEAYTLSGLDGKRGSLPLVFDQRNAEREAELVNRVCNSKPLVLYNFTSHSSPLPSKQDVVNAISKWSSIANLVDTATCGAKSIVDLLALYERASALITIDTSTLHLAAASEIPYAAFIQDKEQWYGSIPLGNCKLAIPYSAALNSLDQLDCVLDDLIPRNLLGNMREPELTISIACHNRLDVTEKCLESVYAHTSRFNLVVTDNASADGTKEYLAEMQKNHANLKVVSSRENAGFQIPHNFAFSKSETPFFCVLNNDTMVSPGWWPKARVAFKNHKTLAVVGNDSNVCSALRDNFDGFQGPNESAEYVEGSLLIVRSAIVKKIGGLFSNYLKFAYGEDSDLSLRAREAGYKIQLLPLGSHHLRGQTVKTMSPIDAQKVLANQHRNHEFLMGRWSIYLRKRMFDYRVSIHRAAGIGDVLAATPIIAAIKQKWPASRIAFTTILPWVFDNNPSVEILNPGKDWVPDFNYDLNFAYEKTPNVHMVTAYAKACGVEVDLNKIKFDIYPSPKDVAFASDLVSSISQPIACVHTGPTGWPGRDWAQSNWSIVISNLRKLGFYVIVIGRDGHWSFPEASLDIQKKTTLQQVYCIMQRAKLFVGIDSSPSFLAQSAGIPCVVLFGTVWSHLRLLPLPHVIGVQATQAAAQCVGEHHRIPPPISESRCGGDCMRAITVGMVMDGITKATEHERNSKI